MNPSTAEDWTDLTPIDAERMVMSAKNEAAKALKEVRAARVNEAVAKKAHRVARTKLLLSGECPRLGNGVSAADRDAWLDARLEEETWELDVARVNRENAEDFVKFTRQDGSLSQTISNSVAQAYQMAGVGQR